MSALACDRPFSVSVGVYGVCVLRSAFKEYAMFDLLPFCTMIMVAVSFTHLHTFVNFMVRLVLCSSSGSVYNLK